MLLAGGALTMTLGFFYIAAVYLTSYAGKVPGVGVLGLDSETILLANIVAGTLATIVCASAGIAADRFGRKRVALVGTVASIVAAPLAFQVMEPGNGVSFAFGLILLFVPLGIPNGCAAAMLPELFRTKFRYSGAGMGYNLAGILGGALPLIFAPRITEAYGGAGIGVYLAALGVISTLCLLAIPETKDVDLDDPAPSDPEERLDPEPTAA